MQETIRSGSWTRPPAVVVVPFSGKSGRLAIATTRRGKEAPKKEKVANDTDTGHRCAPLLAFGATRVDAT